jgi:gliding motility-associated protein GldE
VTREEIDHAIELARDESTTKEEIDILKGIVKFGDITVKQIMRSRVDLVAIDRESTFDEVLKIVRESGFSRFPVYENDLDHIIGFLYAKDLLGYLNKDAEFDWVPLLRPSFFVPESKKIEELLREFQRKRIHMAVVVDEYGGTSGIVTLEDIMEEIIGEIEDEYDVEEAGFYEKIDEKTFLFEGKTLINDFCRVMGIDSHLFDEIKGDYDSLAGLLLELFQRMPEEGESVRYNKYRFEVLDVSDRRIEKVKITVIDDEQDSQ